MYLNWTEEEEKLLIESYLNKGLSFVEIEELNILPNRTKISIKLKVKKLKLKHTKEQLRSIKSRLNIGIKNSMYGKDNWCKGKTKNTSTSLKIISEKNSIKQKENFKKGLIDTRGSKNGMFGKNSWCSGLSKDSNIKIFNACEKSSIIMKEKWNSLSEEEKIKKIGILSKISGFSRKNTLPERIIANVLLELEIEYLKDHHINKFIVDFYIEKYNLIIEVQGDYWHANPRKYLNKELDKIQLRNIKKDENKKKYFIENKISYLFIWEFDIKNKLNEVIEIIKNKINGI